MKLNEIKNEKAIELLADMFDPIAEIATDTEVVSAARSNNKIGMVKLILKNHSRAVFELMALSEGVPVDEYECDVLTPFSVAGSEDGQYLFWLCYGEYRGRREIKPFLAYLKARQHQLYQEQVYRAYVGESLKNISENVAKGFGKEGAVYMAKTYTDIIYPQKDSGRSAEDIIDGIKQKLREYEDGSI